MKILEVKTEKRKLGDLGEKLAAAHLKTKGYKILKRNYVSPAGEIDIIAENKETLAFIEVKSRTIGNDSSYESRPSASVTPEKQRKIISCAKYYIGARSFGKHISLDVIEVYIEKDRKKPIKILHIENAFNLNTANRR